MEHTMSHDVSATQSTRPTYPGTPLAARIWMTFATVIVSGTILGGLLALFEMRASDAALARAQSPGSPASCVLAEVEPRSELSTVANASAGL
jgi:hypothetical protein